MESKRAFDSCLNYIPIRIRKTVEFLPDDIKANVQEIRIRNNMPLCLTVRGKTLFVLEDGQTSVLNNGGFICDGNDTAECFKLLTKQSVFAHTDEIKNGFIRMDSGCRAGISGTFSDSGMVSNISGINIRIARQVLGVAEGIIDKIKGGTLILGPPGSGKTTLLRDVIRLKSVGGKRVSVIDTRGEITAITYGSSPFDLGPNTDIYLIEDRAKGIEMALRTLFPDIIAFDEIGNMAELSKVKASFNSGVDIITTAHIGDFEGIKKREIVKSLIALGCINTVVLLPKTIGEEIKTVSSEEIENDIDF